MLVAPVLVVKLLLGVEISGAAIPLGRVAGVALLALGVACRFAHSDANSCAARGLAGAMMGYNIGAAVVLGTAGIQAHLVGIALWPAVILHAVMAVWCAMSIRSSKV